jgi:predicted nucleotidyltransferase
MEKPQDSLTQLQKRLGIDLKAINTARTLSDEMRRNLTARLRDVNPSDTSVVVYGSLARGEFTKGSDIDWTLLVDGFADPKHLVVVQEIDKIVREAVAKSPGREGTFGTLTFSHELVHQIGGQEDTNRNSTRRILLLLESQVLGRSEAYERVLTNLLRRYILEDTTFVQQTAKHHVPRFLMNDFARQWWTMAVDFAYKQRTRAGKGAAIRNLKLRMSRKMIYVSGLLTCFSCDRALGATQPIVDCARRGEGLDCLRSVRERLQTPLETLSGVLLGFSHLDATARKLLMSYDGFIGMLADRSTREHLENLDPTRYETDEIFQRGRSLSHDFRDGLLELFFDTPSGLYDLTKEYGVF